MGGVDGDARPGGPAREGRGAGEDPALGAAVEPARGSAIAGGRGGGGVLRRPWEAPCP
eukprot:CAMPEP_0174947932 /NCGR_PEP_ID=MMETSP1355-20121228/87859_1 /TAXON_ID=464990 /ORGANISM="Hemiselmis tepida, Strain CCMP443" /LENGTH=57 /DNA_ID=CAMNT_0016195429 /DNA_START=204 /DNA_END=373 /DNA_ORIENTATION=-